MASLALGPFIGGANARDSYAEIAPDELDGSLTQNFTLDERGVATKRNDCPTTSALAGASTPPGAVVFYGYSQTLNVFICQVGTTVYKAAPGAGSWTSFRTTGTSEPIRFVDFTSFIVYVHPSDGLRKYDGTTDSNISATAKGNCIAVWQNRIWVGLTASAVAGDPCRVIFSDPGSISFPVNNFVSIREKDEKALTAMFGGSGLILFKEDSAYRVNDGATGAYSTIDWSNGAVGALAVTGAAGRIFAWGTDGLYGGNGINQFHNIGDKLRPRFLSSNVNATTRPLIAGTTLNDRVYFAFPKASASIPDAILELHPTVGWLMEHPFGVRVGPFANYISAGLEAVDFASGSATVKSLFTGTTRTGYSCALASGYIEPAAGKQARLHRVWPEVVPPASSSLAVTLNYQDDGGYAQTLSSTQSYTNAGLQRQPLWTRRVGRAFQAKVDDVASPLASLSVYGFRLDAEMAEV